MSSFPQTSDIIWVGALYSHHNIETRFGGFSLGRVSMLNHCVQCDFMIVDISCVD